MQLLWRKQHYFPSLLLRYCCYFDIYIHIIYIYIYIYHGRYCHVLLVDSYIKWRKRLAAYFCTRLSVDLHFYNTVSLHSYSVFIMWCTFVFSLFLVWYMSKWRKYLVLSITLRLENITWKLPYLKILIWNYLQIRNWTVYLLWFPTFDLGLKKIALAFSLTIYQRYLLNTLCK